MDTNKQSPAKPAPETQLKPAGVVVITPKAVPDPGAADREIHARHALPIVPDHVDTESGEKNSNKD